MTVRAGPLRHFVTIERLATAKDERGQEIEYWAEVTGVWADIRQAGGREAARGMQIVAEATWVAETRCVPGLDIRHEDRIRYGNHLLEVLTVRDVNERRRMLEIQMKEHTN